MNVKCRGLTPGAPSRRWLEARVSTSLERIRHFFHPGRAELRRIQIALESLKHRLELARQEFTEEADLAQFVASRADVVRLTAPRVAVVGDPFNELDNLYGDLVGDRDSATVPVARMPSLPRAIAETFGRLEAEKKVWRPGKIILPTINRSFEVPIAYQNGRVNYVRPESLARGGKLDDRMAKLSFNGQLIYRHPIGDKEGQLVVLSADPDADPEIENRFAQALNEFNVRFISSAAAEAFAVEVEHTAH